MSTIDEAGGDEHGQHGSGRALTLISLAHGINHAQSALKPLVYPLVLLQLGFGYAELGIMLGVASAVGGALQLVAGGLGRFVKRHLLLDSAMPSLAFVLSSSPSHKAFRNSFSGRSSPRVGGAAQHPVGSALLSHHFQRKHLGTALGGALYRGKRRHRAHPPVRSDSHQLLGLAHHYDSIRAAGDYRWSRYLPFLKGSASEE